ncbi:MAG: hypothetical protein QXL94_00420 [Candidatus Parvarchaeum sp.]
MPYLNEDVIETRRILLGAVGKLNKILDYTSYKDESTGEYLSLAMKEFSSEEINDIQQRLTEASTLADQALILINTMQQGIKNYLNAQF